MSEIGENTNGKETVAGKADKTKSGCNSINPELLLECAKFHYNNFDLRRKYEWKMSLALWAVLAGFVAISIKGE